MTAQQFRKRRRAIRIEELHLEPESDAELPKKRIARQYAAAAPPQEELDYRRRYGGPLGILEPFTYEKEGYQWSNFKGRKGKLCIVCSNRPSTHMAYFQLKGAEKVERFCQECLNMTVYLSTPKTK